jgi:hypothetical protein
MNELDFKILKTENREIWKKLFLVFLQGIPSLYFEKPDKPIPFIICQLSFINRKIRKKDAQKILARLCELGYLILKRRRGYVINWEKVKELLGDTTISEIAQNAGLDFVSCPKFQLCVYERARKSKREVLKK